MNGFVNDIAGIAIKNEDFRQVLYTAAHCQLVVMALQPYEAIGAEVHTLDQFLRVEEGSGETVLDGVQTAIRAGFAVVVPAGVPHNIINTGAFHSNSRRSTRRRIIVTVSSTIPAPTRKLTTNTLTAQRRCSCATGCG